METPRRGKPLLLGCELRLPVSYIIQIFTNIIAANHGDSKTRAPGAFELRQVLGASRSALKKFYF